MPGSVTPVRTHTIGLMALCHDTTEACECSCTFGCGRSVTGGRCHPPRLWEPYPHKVRRQKGRGDELRNGIPWRVESVCQPISELTDNAVARTRVTPVTAIPVRQPLADEGTSSEAPLTRRRQGNGRREGERFHRREPGVFPHAKHECVSHACINNTG